MPVQDAAPISFCWCHCHCAADGQVHCSVAALSPVSNRIETNSVLCRISNSCTSRHYLIAGEYIRGYIASKTHFAIFSRYGSFLIIRESTQSNGSFLGHNRHQVRDQEPTKTGTRPGFRFFWQRGQNYRGAVCRRLSADCVGLGVTSRLCRSVVLAADRDAPAAAATSEPASQIQRTCQYSKIKRPTLFEDRPYLFW
jgi:hypothetical protein